MKKELLLPAGSMEALKGAVLNGADAVYVGGTQYGARAFAPNFTNEELNEATKFCHLYGAKIYVTVNTMMKEDEIGSALEFVNDLNTIEVDAVLVSDLGLMNEIHTKYPDLPIHVSTQAHTFNASQFSFYKKLGATRVVVDREMSLDEIKKLPNTLEIETFIHGALCVSYSGNCLLSALSFGRSGNRGTCTQSCRLPYELLKNGKIVETKDNYLLSTKELNTSHYLKKLMDSNITSFKIEGRMKSPEYVAFITKFYRKLIDGEEITDEDENNLKVLFNRDFTKGYLFDEENIMNMKTSNHQGIPLGKVIAVTPKKIKIKLTDTLTQEDGVRFKESERGMITNFIYDKKDNLIHEANPGDEIYLDNKIGLTTCDTVLKTISKKLMDDLKVYPERKIPITMHAMITYPTFTLIMNDKVHEIRVSEDIVEEARTIGMDAQMIRKSLAKLGDTPFVSQEIQIEIGEHLFIPVSKINEIRRACSNKLIESRSHRWK